MKNEELIRCLCEQILDEYREGYEFIDYKIVESAYPLPDKSIYMPRHVNITFGMKGRELGAIDVIDKHDVPDLNEYMFVELTKGCCFYLKKK